MRPKMCREYFEGEARLCSLFQNYFNCSQRIIVKGRMSSYSSNSLQWHSGSKRDSKMLYYTFGGEMITKFKDIIRNRDSKFCTEG